MDVIQAGAVDIPSWNDWFQKSKCSSIKRHFAFNAWGAHKEHSVLLSYRLDWKTPHLRTMSKCSGHISSHHVGEWGQSPPWCPRVGNCTWKHVHLSLLEKKKAFLHLNPSSAVKLSESWGLPSLHHCKIVWQGQALDVYGYYLWCELLYKTDVSVKVVFHRSVCGMGCTAETNRERERRHSHITICLSKPITKASRQVNLLQSKGVLEN